MITQAALTAREHVCGMCETTLLQCDRLRGAYDVACCSGCRDGDTHNLSGVDDWVAVRHARLASTAAEEAAAPDPDAPCAYAYLGRAVCRSPRRLHGASGITDHAFTEGPQLAQQQVAKTGAVIEASGYNVRVQVPGRTGDRMQVQLRRNHLLGGWTMEGPLGLHRIYVGVPDDEGMNFVLEAGKELAKRLAEYEVQRLALEAAEQAIRDWALERWQPAGG